jgi:hypothetical protein
VKLKKYSFFEQSVWNARVNGAFFDEPISNPIEFITKPKVKYFIELEVI